MGRYNSLIRPARAEDLASILALHRQVEAAPNWSEAVWSSVVQRSLPADSSTVLLLLQEAGTDLAGYVTGEMRGQAAELEFLLVASRLRRQGIGRELLEAWVAIVQSLGATEAFLEVRASNEKALRLYEAASFAQVGRRKIYYSYPTEDALILHRQLP